MIPRAITSNTIGAGACIALLICSSCAQHQRAQHDDPPADTTPQPEPAVTKTPATPQADQPSKPEQDPRESEPAFTEAFPHIRVDPEQRIVEFDGMISSLIDPTGEGRVFYLEQVVCIPSTKEHESLIVKHARPSHLHAALLMIGAEDGHPVYWTYPAGRPVVHDPAGDTLDITVRYTNAQGQTRTTDPLDWVITRDRTSRFPAEDGKWIFAGSTERETSRGLLYEADAAGTVIGLASFGSEVISWSIPISHQEADGDLEWVAAQDAMPPARTPVIVRIHLTEDPTPDDQRID